MIHRHFKSPFAALVKANRDSVLTGIGDDCAALAPMPGHGLYVSTDTLVEGVHFFSDDPAPAVGWKSLACNLSDLAACGAQPIGFTLNLSLPLIDESWVAGFSAGLLEIASTFNCPLVGGDTTSAGANTAKTISITVFGEAPLQHHGFHRALAKAGDDVWVSGTPGLARLGLLLEYQRLGSLSRFYSSSEILSVLELLSVMPQSLKQLAVAALRQPFPRVNLGQSLRGKANACVDLSDGLSGDLAHITTASGLSAVLAVHALQSVWLKRWPELSQLPGSVTFLDTLLNITLQGGDDFELCFTAEPTHLDAIQSINTALCRIGQLEAGEGLWLSQPNHSRQRVLGVSYKHFAEPTL
nr:thiamine-phosphate kinase [Limnobacter parvus]